MDMRELRRGRRQFIKTFTLATAYSSLLGKAWTDILAAEIQPLAASTAGTLRLKLPDFPSLLQESGSVRLGFNPLRDTASGPMPNGRFYPVIINRGPNDTFFALNSRCTHQGCVVPALDPSDNRITCSCHGSIYGIDGRRLSGQATSSLGRYAVNFDGQRALSVQIPNLGYSIVASNVQSGGNSNPRLRLNFRALRNVEYEVMFRASLDSSASAVPFAMTESDPFEQTLFSVTSDANTSLFVERGARLASTSSPCA